MANNGYEYYGASEAWPLEDMTSADEQKLVDALIEAGDRRKAVVTDKIGTIVTRAEDAAK